jgi:tripartite ATP-independent transporter DctM subunit
MTILMIEVAGLWILALLAGLPLFATMGLAAFIFVALAGFTDSIVPQKMANTVNAFPIIAAPLFILMGNILNAAQVTNRIVAFSKSLLGWTRGGLAHASVLASAIFAGMCGSAVADAAGVGSIEIKAMKDAGYRPELAAAISAASATIGPIVPPSLPLVIYGVTADVSVGALFLAGMIPGALMVISLMTMVAIIAKRDGLPAHPFLGLRGIWAAFREAFAALLTPVILLGGILSGVFTPTEGAAVATSYALILGLFVYRTLAWRDLPGIIVQSAETVGVVLALVMTAGALGWCLSILGCRKPSRRRWSRRSTLLGYSWWFACWFCLPSAASWKCWQRC